jgi:hypothetical protein
MDQAVETREIVGQEIFFHTPPPKLNIHTTIQPLDVAIGFCQEEQRGLTVLTYNAKKSYESQRRQAAKTLTELLGEHKPPQITIVAIESSFNDYNSMLLYVTRRLSGYSPIIEKSKISKTKYPIFLKTIVMAQDCLRIIPRNSDNLFDQDDIIEIPYKELVKRDS